MSVGNHESHVVGDGADIGDVICNSFQFEQNGAHELRTRRNLDLRRPLDGLAECRAVGEGRIAGNALGQKHRAVDGKILEELLGSLVRVEHAQLQVEDGLAGDGEVEVAGLDDAGMNRADRNLEDALSVAWAGRRAALLQTGAARCRAENPCAADARRASYRAAPRAADSDGRRLRGRTNPESRAPAS